MNEKVKDSGSTQEFSTGAHRDNPTGKGRCDLLPLKYVAMVMNDPVLTEINAFMEDEDITHLSSAIKYSVKTLDVFHYENIVNQLSDDHIFMNVTLVTDSNKEEILTKCLAHMMLEASKLYEAGAEKYGENNWQLGMPVNRYLDSGIRHYLKTLRGDADEPHYRGFLWNILCAMWTQDHKSELKS